MNKNQVLLLAGIGLVVGLILFGNSTGNARVVAKYLIQHSATVLVTGLLAA
jgi:hypothetical protein